MFYVPPSDVRVELLKSFPGTSLCEWKGTARYWTLESSTSLQAVGWSYPKAQAPYGATSGYYSFYPGRVECFIDGERVRPNRDIFTAAGSPMKLLGHGKAILERRGGR